VLLIDSASMFSSPGRERFRERFSVEPPDGFPGAPFMVGSPAIPTALLDDTDAKSVPDGRAPNHIDVAAVIHDATSPIDQTGDEPNRGQQR